MTGKFEVVTPGFIRRTVSADDITDALSSEHEKPSDSEVLAALVTNNGVAAAVAAKLDVSIEEVYSVVVRTPRTLSTMFRARLMLETFTTLIKVQRVLCEALSDMQPGDLGRTYAATLQAFTNLAGQFEEQEVLDTDDDAFSGKQYIFDKIEKLGKREEAERALGMHEAEEAG